MHEMYGCQPAICALAVANMAKKLFKKLFESFKECQDHPPYAAATPLETTRPRQTLCVLARTAAPECVTHKCRPH